MKKHVFKGGYVFREFFKKHVQATNKETRKNTRQEHKPKPPPKPKHNSKPESKWVGKIRKCLQAKNVQYEEKFRSFPIGDGKYYVPKFVLNEISYGTKHVVIDSREIKPSTVDTLELASFIDKYGIMFHVLLVVHDSYLMEWNKHDKDTHIFDDICTYESISEMVDYLQSKVNCYDDGYVQKKFAKCKLPDGCGRTASGHNEVDTIFGYRKTNDGETIAYTYCKKCRRNMNRGVPSKNSDDWQAKSTYCTGCRSTFIPTILTQSHCESCMQEFRR